MLHGLCGKTTLKQSGRQEIHAPRNRVWEALNDPQILKRCIEGCETFERVGDQSFRASVRARIGPVNALFHANIGLQPQAETDPSLQRFLLQVEIERAEAGFGKGEARVALEQHGMNLTLLSYELVASVGGKMAQIGARLVEAAATSMASSFFANLEREVGTATASQPNLGQGTRQVRNLLWAAAGAALVALVIVLLN